MLGSMAAVALPKARAGSVADNFDRDRVTTWIRERGIESWFHNEPLPLLRISAQIYNDTEQYRRLAMLLKEALNGG
jgi:selenocysteine lyase/cysteine desulfurase